MYTLLTCVYILRHGRNIAKNRHYCHVRPYAHIDSAPTEYIYVTFYTVDY